MAAKSGSQSLQVAVILLSFLVIGLGIGTYYFFNEWDKATKDKTTANKERDDKDRALNAALGDLRVLRVDIIGVPNTTPVTGPSNSVQAMFKQDQNMYMLTFPKEAQKYRPVLPHFLSKLAEIKENTVKQDDKLKQQDGTIKTLEETRKADIAKLFDELKAKYNELKTQYDGFREKEKSQADQIAGLQKDRDDARDKVAEVTKEMQTKVAEKDQEIGKLAQELQDAKTLIEQLSDDSSAFEHPDGQIVWISPSTNTVWINRGRADNLRPQVKFAVYAQVAADVARTDDSGKVEAKKGEIEVTKILGESLAEARVIKSNDLIVTGDLVHTVLWSPGRKEHIALAGDFDVNGDGINDNALIQIIVRQGGGTIDARLDEKGAVVGPGMTFETRYIVVGKPPEQHMAAYTKMQQDAQKKGIRKIDMNQFLDLMGQSKLRGVQDLTAYSADEFENVPRDTDPAAPKDRKFRRRTPSRGKNGAY